MLFRILKLTFVWGLLTLAACSGEDVFESPPLSQFQHTDITLESAAVSRDGQLSIVSEQGKVCVWNNNNNTRLFDCITGDDAKHIELVGLSDDKTTFYISNRMAIHAFSLQTGQLIGSWSTGQNIARDIAISANGHVLLVGYRTGEAEVINTRTQHNTLFKIHRLDINSVALSADGRTAISGSSDKYAYVWSTLSGEILQKFKLATRVNHVSMNEQGSLGFAIDSVDDRVFLDLQSGEELSELNIFANFIEFNDSQFINNDKWFLTGSPKSKIYLWQVASGNLLAEYGAATKGQRSSILAVGFDEGAQQITTQNSSGVLEIWPYQSQSKKD
ncbi:WD40 repeat domain-containing protein [Pseudoalteromonas sp. H105]|uniref:WD40 repeat domain-containing protein n=1 Tax=Pseudoalteromonas sp. H105 TaxID=1348393 RepID=UPI0007322C14|nr:hypothetical protein [Pseudoalteromonas sp. H105]KTF16945.1 hypothetical protein ATS75_05740 [Pseudoalteromonas sp. H105]